MSELKLKKAGCFNYYLSKNRTPLLFHLSMVVSWLIYIIYSVIQSNSYYRVLLFGVGSDTFMDFFNSCRDAAQGMGCYTERHVIYPPMANLFYKFCNHFITDNYLDTDIWDKFKILDQPSNMMVYVFITAIFLGIIILLLNEFIEGSKLFKSVTALALIATYPMIYTIERGNIIIIAFLLVLVFVMYYDSDNKWLSEFACICLALAASIKMYPAMYGLMLIIAKKYKQAIRTVVYGVLMFVLPFGAYGWFKGMKIWKDNIVGFSQIHSLEINFAGVTSAKSTLYIAVYKLTGKYGLNVYGDYILSVVVIFALILAVILLKKNYQKYIAMVVLLDCIPGAGGAYTFIFLIIPLVMMLKEKKIRLYDYLYFFVIMGMFVPHALPLKFEMGYVSTNYGIEGLEILFLFLLVVADLIYTVIVERINKNNNNPSKKILKEKKAKKVVATMAVTVIALSFVVNTMGATVYADESSEDSYYSEILEIDGVTYKVASIPEEEIPYSFIRTDYIIDGNNYPIITRYVGEYAQFGWIVVFYADAGDGYKLYQYDTAMESLIPFLYLTYNGVEYPILAARFASFTGKMLHYEVNFDTILGVSKEVAYFNYLSSFPGFEEKNRYLVCLLNEDNKLGYYSYEILDGTNANIELYDEVVFYPLPESPTIANHTLAKKLHASAEMTTIISMTAIFVPTVLLSALWVFIEYKREKKLASK